MNKLNIRIFVFIMAALLFVTLQSTVRIELAIANQPISGSRISGLAQDGPEWYNSSWSYRLPITITNGGGQLDNYQVLVQLDQDNFDFNKADAHGWDVRFTNGDGTSLIDFWLESWSKSDALAYIWVKIPILLSGNNTIYLYYGNSSAGTASSGTDTFTLFDNDWSQFDSGGGGCPAGIPWDCISPGATVSAGNLILLGDQGVVSHLSFSHKAVGYRAIFGSGNGKELGGFINGSGGPRTLIRDLSVDPANMYLQDFAYLDVDNSLLARVGSEDWHNMFHVYEIRWWVDDQNSENNQSIGIIDHGESTATSLYAAEVPSGPLSVSFNNQDSLIVTLLVDWVYVREYRLPEPEVTVGSEQGLVDLQISMTDSPDPLFAGERLTYSILITNTSSIDAHGVTLTDTLPPGVSFVSIAPSQGSCNSVVVCSLNIVHADSTATIELLVTALANGAINNTASVDSQDFDQYTSNNTILVGTTVIPSADLGISLKGSAEAVKLNDTLTYVITATNQGPSNVDEAQINVILPVQVDYQSSSPSICVENATGVTCTLGNLISDTDFFFQIKTKVIGTTTISMSSTATISSITHEPNPTNNTSTEETLVDSIKPSVAWVNPVNKEDETYVTKGELILLEASAADNDQVSRVEFYYWDHLYDYDGDGNNEGRYVVIDITPTSPYQVEFDSHVLVPSQIYQVWIRSYDRANNISERQRIFIERLPEYLFIPLISK